MHLNNRHVQPAKERNLGRTIGPSGVVFVHCERCARGDPPVAATYEQGDDGSDSRPNCPFPITTGDMYSDAKAHRSR